MSNKSITKVDTTYVVTESVMENNQTGGSTMLNVSNIQRNIEISDNDVGIKGLRE